MQFELRLRESEELFHIQVEGVKDYAVFMLDTQGNVLNWNAGAERLKGYRDEEIIGKHFSCFYTEEERAAGKPGEELKKAAAEGRVADEGWRIRKDGSRFWADVIITALHDENGNLRGFSIVTRDNTERKKTEDALRFSEERYRALFRDNPTMIVTLDTKWKMLSVNPFCASQLGYTTNELEGQSVLNLFHEDDRPAVTEQLQMCLRNPDQVYHWQFRKIRKDGSLLWVEETAQAVYDLGGALNVLVVSQDITERKRAEEEQEQLLVQLDAVLNSINEGVIISDLEGNVLTMNPSALAIHEYENVEQVRRQLHLYQETFELSDLDGHPVPFEQWPQARALRGERFADYEVSVRRKDTDKSWIGSYSGTPVQTKSGDIILSVVTLRDITERKRVEEALRESENKFSKVFQTTPSILVITSLADGRYLEVNEAFERVMGYRRDEVIGRTSMELHIWQNPEDRAIVLRMLAEGKKVHDMEIGLRNKSGTILVGLYSTEIIEIGAEQCLLNVLNDITARKKAEEELRHSEERYRRLYNDTPVMLHSIDHDGRLVSVSNYWLETLGYERSEVLGRLSTEFLTAASRYYATEFVLPEYYRTGSCKEVPYQMVKKNGEILDVLLSAIAERDSEGKVVRSLAVIVDVTDRKQADEEIERLNTDLAARAAELEAANRELEAFNYTVAHDLRKPLTVVNGYCQAIQELCGDKLGEQCKGFLREAYDGTWRMNRLIDALLNFSRLAHVETRRETVDFSAMAHEVAAELKLAEPKRRVTFLIADGVSADGDAALLRVVLDNLLGNAWKYSGMREETVIEFSATEIDGMPVYFVRDNGVGFNKADADKLFVPFQRLPGAEECKGFGIGLATVEKIIRRHGGKVWAKGEPGNGATFYFTLSGDKTI
ncbi:PAS domain S-box protein [Geotalea uraniireducens]|uniref:histidine kinase n=1 Tax=Geotalea uraniireducens (strain Rf4) TaxID=351605 RepID=A5G3U3_GEOUR|nr:PAS domain S-box protein [Geotalea uraniireducens]ABQ26461.1 PAS/PAC sensor signal transduction histidine kinase [Geotalea uraniireducens Rf4]